MSDPLIMQAMARLVPHGARVLDLGCGDGALLAYLQQHKGCTGYGVELDDTNVHACVQRGVNVIQLNLDEGLSLFADQSFDVVLQIDTLQHLRNAETMLRSIREDWDRSSTGMTRLGLDLILVDAELLHDDVLDLFCNGRHRAAPPFGNGPGYVRDRVDYICIPPFTARVTPVI